MREVEKAKKISGYCWKAFRKFMESEHTEADWDEFIKAGEISPAGFEKHEIDLFGGMLIAFMNYADDCFKKRGN